ncbi:MAG: prepilin-type N-terminal cleavage/methylation domain-containing protein [Candidatus Roizmanbacteria bacterium]|nr:prepilin-type N-terminal cleavage/methylation domain-containing protein [Candidatus Roizmanbacteria bacterium]
MKIKSGFTLIELLVVIMILGILAALISGNFFTSLKKGRDAKRKADLEQTQRALEMYYEDKKAYPVTAGLTFGSKFCENNPCGASDKVYMQKIPNDPISGKNYQYLSADGTNYKLFACLENNLQMLPYISSGYTISTMTSCGSCKNSTGGSVANCVWGVSSSNVSP